MFIKLTTNADITYWEDNIELRKTISEKVYIHISKAYLLYPCGTATIIQFPGDRITVKETPEQILKLIKESK